MNESSKRRWFRYGLRGMFVVVAVIACLFAWIASNYRLIQLRRTALCEVEADGGTICLCPSERPFFGPPRFSLDSPEGIEGRIPRVRQLLGDMTVDHIGFPQQCDYEERIKRLFPEAEFFQYGGHWFH